MKIFSTIAIVFFINIIILLQASPSYAYLDPGTGSFALQMLIASVVGGLFFLKRMWAKIKGIFSTKKCEKSDEKIEES